VACSPGFEKIVFDARCHDQDVADVRVLVQCHSEASVRDRLPGKARAARRDEVGDGEAGSLKGSIEPGGVQVAGVGRVVQPS
jgi:hypothetical protein